MEYFPYNYHEGKECSDEGSQKATHQVNYSSSDQQSDNGNNKRNGKALKDTSDLTEKQAQQRYKSLVEQNHQKNSSIWLRSNSIVRVPKALRKDLGAVETGGDGDQPKRRSKSEMKVDEAHSDQQSYSESPGQRLLHTEKVQKDKAKLMLRRNTVQHPPRPECETPEDQRIQGVPQTTDKLKDIEGTPTQQHELQDHDDKAKMKKRTSKKDSQEEASQDNDLKKSSKEQAANDIDKNDASLLDQVMKANGLKSSKSIQVSNLDLTREPKNTKSKESLGAQKQLGGDAAQGESTPYLGTREKNRTQSIYSSAKDAISQKRSPTRNEASDQQNSQIHEVLAPFQTKRTGTEVLENSKEIEDAHIEIEERFKDEASREQFIIQNSLNYASIDQAENSSKQLAYSSQGQSYRNQAERPDLNLVNKSSSMVVDNSNHINIIEDNHPDPVNEIDRFEDTAKVHDQKNTKVVMSSARQPVAKPKPPPQQHPTYPGLQQTRRGLRIEERVQSTPKLASPYQSNDASSSGTQQTCNIIVEKPNIEKDGQHSGLGSYIRVDKRKRQKQKNQEQAKVDQKVEQKVDTNISKKSFHALGLQNETGRFGAPTSITALDKSFGIEKKGPQRSHLNVLSIPAVDMKKASAQNLRSIGDEKEETVQAQAEVKERALESATAREEPSLRVRYASPSSHTVMSRQARACGGIDFAGKREEFPTDSLSGRQNCEISDSDDFTAKKKKPSMTTSQSQALIISAQQLKEPSLYKDTESTVKHSQRMSSRVGVEPQFDQESSGRDRRIVPAQSTSQIGAATSFAGHSLVINDKPPRYPGQRSTSMLGPAGTEQADHGSKNQATPTEITYGNQQSSCDIAAQGQGTNPMGSQYQNQASQTSFQSGLIKRDSNNGLNVGLLHQLKLNESSLANSINGDRNTQTIQSQTHEVVAKAGQISRSRDARGAMVVHTGSQELKERNVHTVSNPSRASGTGTNGTHGIRNVRASKQSTDEVISQIEIIGGGTAKANASAREMSREQESSDADNHNEPYIEAEAVSAAAMDSQAFVSQLALCSSAGGVNEADLISSQEPTHNDYLADESGGDAGNSGIARKQKSVYVQLYLKQGSENSEDSLEQGQMLTSDQLRSSRIAKAEVVDARIVSNIIKESVDSKHPSRGILKRPSSTSKVILEVDDDHEQAEDQHNEKCAGEEDEDTQVLNDEEVLSASRNNHRESEKQVSFVQDDGIEVPRDGSSAQRSQANSAPGEDSQIDVASFIDLILDGTMAQVQGKDINLQIEDEEDQVEEMAVETPHMESKEAIPEASVEEPQKEAPVAEQDLSQEQAAWKKVGIEQITEVRPAEELSFRQSSRRAVIVVDQAPTPAEKHQEETPRAGEAEETEEQVDAANVFGSRGKEKEVCFNIQIQSQESQGSSTVQNETQVTTQPPSRSVAPIAPLPIRRSEEFEMNIGGGTDRSHGRAQQAVTDYSQQLPEAQQDSIMSTYRSCLHATQSPIVAIEANIDRKLGGSTEAGGSVQGHSPSQSAPNDARSVERAVLPAAVGGTSDDAVQIISIQEFPPQASAGQTDGEENQASVHDASAAQVHSTGRFPTEEYPPQPAKEERPQLQPLRDPASRQRDRANRTQAAGPGRHGAEESPRIVGAKATRDAARLEAHGSPRDGQGDVMRGLIYPKAEREREPGRDSLPDVGGIVKQVSDQDKSNNLSGASLGARLASHPDALPKPRGPPKIPPLPAASKAAQARAIVPSMPQHSGGGMLASIEPNHSAMLDISDSEFVRKYKQIRESREVVNMTAPDHGYRDVIEVAVGFDLKEFMDRNQIPVPFKRQSHAGSGLGLAIHDFHKQNREKGGWKNNGPRDLSNEALRHGSHALGVGSLARDRMVNEAMQGTRQLLARSLEAARSNVPFNAKSAVPASDTIAHVNNDYEDPRTRQIAFQRAIQSGQIDINNVYMIVQLIKRAHREPVLTDAQIEAHLQRSKHNSALGSGSRESCKKLMMEFKWHEVMRFMHRNPQILLQLLSMYGISAGGVVDIGVSRQSDGQFFNRRPRYTEKILQQIYHGLPGLIGHLHNASGPGGGASQAPYIQPFAPQPIKQRRHLRGISKNQPNQFQMAAPLPLSKRESQRGTGRYKQQSVDQPLRMQSRMDNNSFSPVVNRHRDCARKLAEGPHGTNAANRYAGVRGSFSQLNPGPLHHVARSMQVPSAETTSEVDHPYLATSALPDAAPYAGEAYNQAMAEAHSRKRHPQNELNGNTIINIEIPHDRHDRVSEPIRKHVGGKDVSSRDRDPKMEAGEAAPRLDQRGAEARQYASQFNVMNEGQEAITSYDDGTGQSQNCTQNQEMKMMLESVDLKKPKTNERQRRRQKKCFMGPNQIINSHSVNAQPHDPFRKKPIQPGTESKRISADDQKSNVEQVVEQNQRKGNWETQPKPLTQAKAPNADQRTELTSGGSLVHSRFEELANQRKALEMEEEDLGRQRNAIVAEKDKVTRQLRRLDRKQELLEQEDLVKKQRMVLEIEKKTLREDIAELDNLKQMLEQRKKDTATGFSELAESNKELRSLKSGDLHRERSLMLSKQSGRSKAVGAKAEGGQAIGNNTEENYAAKLAKPSLLTGQQYPAQPDGNKSVQPAQVWDKESSPNKFDPVHDPSRTAAEPDGAGTFDSNQRSRTLEHSGVRAHDHTDGQSKPTSKDQEARPHSSASKDSIRDSQRSRLISTEQRSRKSVHDAYQPSEQLVQYPQNPLALSLNAKPADSAYSKHDQKSLMTGSPISQSNMTFLSGTGVFDWAQSTLMDDVLNNRAKFGKNEEADDGAESSVKSFLDEDEVFQLIEQIKSSQKTLRDSERLQSVFHKALDTLQELMMCMNQTILFQMIAKKYTEVSMDNTVKLLVRCKQLLQSRSLAYKTLNGIVVFENATSQIRRDVDNFLESSPREELMQEITKQSMEDLPKLVQEVIGNIAELRDQYKLFSKMGATTSKGNQVLNVMAYKRRDAMRYLLREYEAIKRLVQVVDVHMPPVSPQ